MATKVTKAQLQDEVNRLQAELAARKATVSTLNGRLKVAEVRVGVLAATVRRQAQLIEGMGAEIAERRVTVRTRVTPEVLSQDQAESSGERTVQPPQPLVFLGLKALTAPAPVITQ